MRWEPYMFTPCLYLKDNQPVVCDSDKINLLDYDMARVALVERLPVHHPAWLAPSDWRDKLLSSGDLESQRVVFPRLLL
jgi:hypothetical protein